MKRNLYLLLFAFVCLFSACSKKEAITDVVVTIPPVAISNISLPSFTNSTWVQVAGGTAIIQYKLKDSKDSTSSVTKDSIDLKNLSAYKKSLAAGTYDIILSSKNQSAAADTFIRVTETAKGYTVPSQQAPVFTETSTDGLITIGKSFIKDGTIPTFKTDTGTKTYKLGLNNGFYYLYIKGGLQGAISFTAKAGGQAVVKKLSIVAAKHQNMSVVTNGVNGVSVVFTDFAYNQVSANSTTLITININPDRMSGYTSYYVATDEIGNIIGEAKYQAGTTTFKLTSTNPYEKDRLNFYEIKVADNATTVPGITGYLQVKKGSVYTQFPSQPSPQSNAPLNIHLKNAAQFDKLSISTDRNAGTITSAADSVNNLKQWDYSSNSQVWVQVLKNNQTLYNLFDISKGTHDYTVDLAQCTKTAVAKTITAPGGNFQMNLFGKNDVTATWQYDHDLEYNFGIVGSQYNSLIYNYPSEAFKSYVAVMYYTIGDYNYNQVKIGAVPDNADSFGAAFTVAGTSMADFQPSFSGTFDYYQAHFVNAPSTPNLSVYLLSPSAAAYTNVKFPDFSKYLNLTSLDLSKVKLANFGLYQQDTFNETKVPYNDTHNYHYLNSKSVQKNY